MGSVIIFCAVLFFVLGVLVGVLSRDDILLRWGKVDELSERVLYEAEHQPERFYSKKG